MELISFQGLIILGVLGVLLFGERLPEVAAKFGKQFMELKKSVQGIRTEIEALAFDAKHTVARSLEKVEDQAREEAAAPKFEPPPAEPAVSGLAEAHGSYGCPPADNS